MMKKGLGKGLGALITSSELEGSDAVKELKINDIEPNRDQPRKSFNDEKLSQLAESIKQHGIVQPIIVTKDNDTYKIIAGERRWRAARLAGLVTVPVVVRDATSKQIMELALIENLQREDLNPVEEAEAYERLMKEYNLTQEEISNTVGKSRPAIANSLRLLSLNENIKNYLINGDITSGHARAIIVIDDKELQLKIAKEVIERELNVRDTEKLVKRYTNNKVKTKKEIMNEEFLEIEDKLKNIFGTKVKLINKNKKGRILIEYYSNDELDRILEMIDSIKK